MVLGMHKSGTTLVAATLDASGVDMGRLDGATSYDAGNHCERPETQRINKALIGCADNHSLSVLRVVTPDEVSPERLREMAELVGRLDALHPRWGFKDPRSCLTVTVWHRVLGDYRVVGVHRHPLELWHHYARSKRLRRRVQRGFRALTAWYVYNRELLSQLERVRSRGLLLDYSRLMARDEELAALAGFLGIGAGELKDLREPRLQRAGRSPSRLYTLACLGQRLLGRDIGALQRALEARSGQASNETRSSSSQR